MNKGRLEAFTDAIIAIIATIMVLDLVVPKIGTVGKVLPCVAYAVSFILVFLYPPIVLLCAAASGVILLTYIFIRNECGVADCE